MKQHPQTSPNVYFHLFFLCVLAWYSVKKITLKRRCLFFYACSVLELIPILFKAHYRLPIFNCKYFLREDCRHIAIPRCCWRGINLLPTVSNLPNHILVNNIIFLANINILQKIDWFCKYFVLCKSWFESIFWQLASWGIPRRHYHVNGGKASY